MGVTGIGTPRSFPNQFATNFTSTGLTGLDFGFEAALVKLVVDSGTVYLDLSSTGGVNTTTNGFKVSSGETHDFYDFGVPIHGLAWQTTTSSTSAVTGRIGAWG